MKLFHLDNKGFAMAGVVYPLLVLFVMLLLGTLGLLASRKVLLDRTNREAADKINSSNTYEYISDGLIGYYDGYQGAEKKGDKYIWKDLSGSGNHGEMVGFDYSSTPQQGALTFTGKEYVKLPQMNYEQITLEVVMSPGTSGTMQIVGNLESGGYALTYYNAPQALLFQVNVNGTYLIDSSKNLYGNFTNSINRMVYASGSYDNAKASFYQNGTKYEIAAAGTITKPQNNTIMMIGANPAGNAVQQEYFVGKVYAVRIYNRALSEDEVLHNYQVDKRRYQMFE
mgnify:FL=1